MAKLVQLVAVRVYGVVGEQGVVQDGVEDVGVFVQDGVWV
jgi:hypothetical protein